MSPQFCSCQNDANISKEFTRQKELSKEHFFLKAEKVVINSKPWFGNMLTQNAHDKKGVSNPKSYIFLLPFIESNSYF